MQRLSEVHGALHLGETRYHVFKMTEKELLLTIQPQPLVFVGWLVSQLDTDPSFLQGIFNL